MSLPEQPPPDTVQASLEEGPGRYMPFANRLRTAFTAGLRYSAYSSELGEAFRPLTKPIVVRSLYGISWSYVIGDVGYAGYQARNLHRELTIRQQLEEKDPQLRLKRLAEEAKERIEKALGSKEDAASLSHHAGPRVPHIDPLEMSENTHVALTCVRRGVFQSLASMALPAFTVHSIVHYSQPLFKGIGNHRVRAMGPTVLGLAIIPALPIMFDEPVEHIIDTIFDWGEGQFFPTKNTAPRPDVKDLANDVVDDAKTVGQTPIKSAALLVGAGGLASASAARFNRGPLASSSSVAMLRGRAPPMRAMLALGAAGIACVGVANRLQQQRQRAQI